MNSDLDMSAKNIVSRAAAKAMFHTPGPSTPAAMASMPENQKANATLKNTLK